MQPVKLQTRIADSSNQLYGILVIGIEDDSPADQAGLVQGDVLIQIGETGITQVDDLLEFLSSGVIGTRVPLRIVRGGEALQLEIEIGERIDNSNHEAKKDGRPQQRQRYTVEALPGSGAVDCCCFI